MKSTGKAFARFCENDSGSYAIMGALASAVMVGAVGYGLDTYRLENARTELDHVVGLTCDRIENADIALYPDSKSRVAMANTYAKAQVPQTALEAERTSFKISPNGDKITVAGQTEIDATLMAAIGFSELEGKSSRDCTPPSTKPPEKACTSDDVVYLNPGTFETSSGQMIGGSRNFAATLFDKTGTIKARQVIGNGSGITEVFLKASTVDDMVVVQPFNADGTVPALCNPTLPCTDPNTCPTTKSGSACTAEKADDLAKLEFGIKSVPWIPNWDPIAKSLVPGSRYQGRYVGFGISNDYTPMMVQVSNGNNGSGFLRSLDAFPGSLPQSFRAASRGAKLYRILYQWSAVWELNGQCIIATSPIALDLPGLGHIATTGVSGARYLIPQHPVNATVEFASGVTDKPFTTEWITGNGQALLVDNRDGKAATDMNGTRLFGNMGGYAHGYEKLAKLDTNKDGKISDAELQGLAAWIDNGDAKVQDGELKPLAEVGITELSTVMTETPTGDGGIHMRSTATMNGKTIMTEDVWFGIDITGPQRVSQKVQ